MSNDYDDYQEYRQALFNHLANEYNRTLLDSELNELEHIIFRHPNLEKLREILKSERARISALESCLLKAMELLRDSQMFIEADNIDWSRFNEGPDHDPNYKPVFPEIVTRINTLLAKIREVTK